MLLTEMAHASLLSAMPFHTRASVRRPGVATAPPSAGGAALRVAPQLKQRRVCSRLRSSATSTVPEAVTEASDREQWAACNQLVQQRCGASEDEANTALLRAFGWKGQGFWRQERVKQVPCPEQVAASLDFLAGLGISDAADVGPLVGGFPEVLGLRVEVMQENVDVLKKKWFLKGNVLLNSVKRKPRALGNIIDCEGTCAGLCTRCWAQM